MDMTCGIGALFKFLYPTVHVYLFLKINARNPYLLKLLQILTLLTLQYLINLYSVFFFFGETCIKMLY